MDRFDAMATYVTVVELGGFAAAARRLARSRATVSRQIQQLESHLQVRLLNRTTRTLKPTTVGSTYFAFARDFLERVREAELRISEDQQEPTGQLRVVSTKSFGSEVLADAVADFAALHRSIQPTLVVEDFSFRSYDFMEQGYDLAIWLSDLRESRLIGRKLATLKWTACAAPSYLEQCGEPTTPDDLDNHRCLAHINFGANDGRWTLIGADGAASVRISSAMSSNSALVLRKAALNGLGIALLPQYLIDEDLRLGNLVQVLRTYQLPERNLMMYVPERRFMPRQVRMFIDFLSNWMRNRIGRAC